MTSSDPSSSSSSSSSSTLSQYISVHPSFSATRSPHSPLPALYSSLSRQRKSNPSGYSSSIEWWKTILLDVTFSGSQFDAPSPAHAAVDRTVFRLDESTKAAWTVDGVGRPLGLGTVVGELERGGTLVECGRYLRSNSAIVGPKSGLRQYLTVGSVASVLATPVRWAASSIHTAVVGSSDDDDLDEALFRAKQAEWVCFPLVVRIASTFASHLYASTSSPLSLVMSIAEFQRTLSDACRARYGWTPSARDGQVVLKYLCRDSSPRLAVHQTGVVKLSPSENEAVEPVTDEDRSVVAVKETLRKLELQITSLESQISHRTAQISSSLRSGNKPQAASYLRSRKALHDVLAKRTTVKANLDTVVSRIEQAKTDVEVMRAYKASDEVLRALLGREELKVENVERTMEGLHEAMDEHRVVEEAMKGEVAGEVDEDEVMDELRMLEMEAQRDKVAQRQEKEEKQRESNEKDSEMQQTHQKAEQDKQQQEKQDKKDHDDLQARLDRLRLAQSPPPSSVPLPSTLEDNADHAADRNKASPTAIAE